jgi:Na+/H+-dicarboxylate symporter
MSSDPPGDRPNLPAPADPERSRQGARFPGRQWKGQLSVEPQRIFGTVVKLFVLSVVVGWVISVLDLSLEGFFEHLADAFGSVVDWMRWILGWTLPYAAIGALVVVPLWAISLLLRLTRRRGPPPEEPPAP